jgi:dipeptidase E
MKLLLTSAGIKNTSIQEALVALLGKPIAESSALCIPTAIYAFPGGAGMAWKLISGRAASPLCELGWKSFHLCLTERLLPAARAYCPLCAMVNLLRR